MDDVSIDVAPGFDGKPGQTLDASPGLSAGVNPSINADFSPGYDNKVDTHPLGNIDAPPTVNAPSVLDII